jgi:hypothetical protein
MRTSKGGFSFAPPFVCGILGALVSLLVLQDYRLWASIAFVLLDPSIGFVLICIGIQTWRKQSSRQ